MKYSKKSFSKAGLNTRWGEYVKFLKTIKYKLRFETYLQWDDRIDEKHKNMGL